MQIQKDLLRTFQKIDLFATQNMKNKLMRILKALVAYDPCNGYTQGMNFIAAGLIVHWEESTTFWLCTCLLEKYEIREVYWSEFSGMYAHIRFFNLLLKRYLPEVFEKYEECEMQTEIYMMEWILSFMCSYIPINWLVSLVASNHIVRILQRVLQVRMACILRGLSWNSWVSQAWNTHKWRHGVNNELHEDHEREQRVNLLQKPKRSKLFLGR